MQRLQKVGHLLLMFLLLFLAEMKQKKIHQETLHVGTLVNFAWNVVIFQQLSVCPLNVINNTLQVIEC